MGSKQGEGIKAPDAREGDLLARFFSSLNIARGKLYQQVRISLLLDGAVRNKTEKNPLRFGMKLMDLCIT